ncbi:hypothetical protein SESBI_14892 [Sesbania bispinosa]|nr:hypothetical protein SESBI_14892 [Sesbania bispinosa]
MVGGTSIGASGGQSTNKEHDASSEFAPETQTPLFFPLKLAWIISISMKKNKQLKGDKEQGSPWRKIYS